MITPKTQAAIAMLNDIYNGDGNLRAASCRLSPEMKRELLHQLTVAGLIRLEDENNPQSVQSYRPTGESADVSLLDILEATGEHLNCNHPTAEEFYSRYGRAAQKLGIVNQITRMSLQEIKLYDL